MRSLLVASLFAVLFETPSPGSAGGPAPDPPAPRTPDTPAPGSPRLGDQVVSPPDTKIVRDADAPKLAAGDRVTDEEAVNSLADLSRADVQRIANAAAARLAQHDEADAAKAIADRPKWDPLKPAILLEDGRVVAAPSLLGDRLAHRAPLVKAAGVNYIHVSEVLETQGDVTFERWVYRQDVG